MAGRITLIINSNKAEFANNYKSTKTLKIYHLDFGACLKFDQLESEN
jgi:hypothetical protein